MIFIGLVRKNLTEWIMVSETPNCKKENGLTFSSCKERCYIAAEAVFNMDEMVLQPEWHGLRAGQRCNTQEVDILTPKPPRSVKTFCFVEERKRA
ncbi:hypothetical protein ILYODFUR_010847 [Ilyodon furcidens]|uniref:Uncharacterized protein n=1 Tax=Ilyodon furcidens TaxID=33524 RepID=A0ABV0UH93_9TELE